MYDMFGDIPQEQELYHSIATVGTLLLQLGEVGKKFYLKRSSPSESSSIGETPLSCSVDSTPDVDQLETNMRQASLDDKPSDEGNSNNTPSHDSVLSDTNIDKTQSGAHSKPDAEWSISFEQFIASILTEPPLVEYFEKKCDITESVNRVRNRRLAKRQLSAFPDEQKK